MTTYETIDLEGLKQRLDDDDSFVINVLSEDSYTKQHIPDTRNVPEGADDFGDRIRDMVPDREAPIVVYCADEDCQASPRAAEKLVEMGYENVFDFEGGLQEWKDAGLDVEGETEQVEANVA